MPAARDVHEKLDAVLVRRATLGALTYAVLVVASAWSSDRRLAVLGLCVAWQGASATAVFALTGAKRRSIATPVLFVINTAASLGLGWLTGWSPVAAGVVPLSIIQREMFSEGNTRPFVVAKLVLVGGAMLAGGVAWAAVAALVLVSGIIHWLASTRGLVLRGVLAELDEELKLKPLVEAELRQAQKLESVGRLAAGIAHELNTPAQYVMDSVEFLGDGVATQRRLLEQYRAAAPATAALKQAETEADLEFLDQNLGPSVVRAREGLQRIAAIVRSMRDFARPEEKEMAPVDVNRGIESTLVIARGEYKLVAEVEKKLEPDLEVRGLAGELNQVVLSILVNAAHAIGDRIGKSGPKGRITVESRREGRDVVLSISDTGGGIPEAIRDRIFEPFFSTKAVGRGTGQSLAVARSVVNKHGGTLTFETRVGDGTTFSVRLPALVGKERAGA